MSERSSKMLRAVRFVLGAVILTALTYQLVSVWYTIHGALEFYYLHLGLILAVTALSLLEDELEHRRPRGRRMRACVAVLLTLCLVVTAVSAGYLNLLVDDIELRQPFITDADFAAGAGVIAVVLVLSWFVWGRVLTSLMAAAILYFAFGHMLPGRFGHTPYEPDILMSYLAGMGGARGVLWGIPLSANTLFLIILFGGLMQGARVLELFNEIGKALLNITRGGVCYSAVIASSLIGMVTGQAVANIALSGSMTIPSMTQRGLSAERAGAIEILASLGSQLLPPIMGLGAFLMAVTLGVPYIDIVSAAVIPAILYVATVLIAIRYLVDATPELTGEREDVDVRLILWILPSFLLSFVVLVVLLYLRFSPGYSAFWAIALLTASAFARPREYRPTLRQLVSGAAFGVVSASKLALVLAGIGLVVQVLVTTGAGFDLGRLAMDIAAGRVEIALLLGMVVALLIGMGLPTPAAYALTAIIMIPFLIDLGIEPLVAHFFGFYFAIFSAITPPVAVGVMTAVRISAGSFYGTFLECAKMAVLCVLIPFTFVAFPSLLGFPDMTFAAIWVSITLLATTATWSAGVYGVADEPLGPVERSVMVAGILGYVAMLATTNLWLSAIPLAVFTIRLASTARRRAVRLETGAGAGT